MASEYTYMGVCKHPLFSNYYNSYTMFPKNFAISSKKFNDAIMIRNFYVNKIMIGQWCANVHVHCMQAPNGCGV